MVGRYRTRYGKSYSDAWPERDVAHNVYVARGREAGGEGEQLDHVRIFVWARNNVVGAKAGGPLNTYSIIPVQ